MELSFLSTYSISVLYLAWASFWDAGSQISHIVGVLQKAFSLRIKAADSPQKL
jgi:hypothetical protein